MNKLYQNKKLVFSLLLFLLILALFAGVIYLFGQTKGNSQSGEIDYAKYESKGFTKEKVDQILGRIALLQTEIDKEPTAYDYVLQQGSLYRILGEYDKAEEYYFKALDINPDFGPAYGELANIYVYPFKDYDKAVEYYQLAIEKEPYRSDYYRWLADLYVSQFPEKKGEIEDLLVEGSKVTPGNEAVFYSYLASFFKNEGNIAKAKEYANKYLKINPEDQVMIDFLKELNNTK